jgi:hypothetical protein
VQKQEILQHKRACGVAGCAHVRNRLSTVDVSREEARQIDEREAREGHSRLSARERDALYL